ncbi:PqqD family protein [Hazenella sp. IB182353]|uniref:PqqD family protein n=1 Tax=Polycladospora coralii TaxID=2771432 RepID=UPI001747964D|nr:PqqD family protein [Polycladospora coralii]MBS7529533.1 PqqD family protein [Polycladospora coralii]
MIQISNSLELTNIDGKYVILDCRKNTFYGINQVGVDFLAEIRAHGDFSHAISNLSDKYQASYEAIELDLKTFLQILIDKGMVVGK